MGEKKVGRAQAVARSCVCMCVYEREREWEAASPTQTGRRGGQTVCLCL